MRYDARRQSCRCLESLVEMVRLLPPRYFELLCARVMRLVSAIVCTYPGFTERGGKHLQNSRDVLVQAFVRTASEDPSHTRTQMAFELLHANVEGSPVRVDVRL